MATRQNSGNISTMEDFTREYEVEPIRIDALFLRNVFWDYGMLHKIVVNDTCSIDKYLEEMEENKSSYQLSTQEYYKWRFNPKLMSFDIYGTTELWFLILAANELYSASEFDLKKIKMYDISAINKIERIITLENQFKRENEDDVYTELQTPIS